MKVKSELANGLGDEFQKLTSSQDRNYLLGVLRKVVRKKGVVSKAGGDVEERKVSK